MKKKVISIALVLALALSLAALSGCGSSKVTLNVYNWGEYISDGSEDSLDSNAAFEEWYYETFGEHVRVNYSTFSSNEDMYAKLASGSVSYDVVVPSDYMIQRLIAEGLVQKLDHENIPNLANLHGDFYGENAKFDYYDKGCLYSVPYMYGMVGIIYNTTMVDEPITSWGAMFDEKYAGQVLMINNSRDALMAALCYLGYDINTTDEGQLTEAFELVKNAKDKGVYQAFVMDEVFGKMEGGNAAITMYYAGDYLTMLENNEDLAFVIPEEGSNWFVDAMCVLKSSQHKAEAYEWINFIASTDSNLANMDYIWYASPNAEALAEYPAYYEETYGESLDEEIYNIMAIPDEERERCEIYVNLPQETLKFYDKLWTQLGV